MQAIRAIYDGEGFKVKQPIPVQGQYEVVITFLEPFKKERLNEHEPKNIFNLSGLNLLADDYDYKKMREAKSFDID